MFFWVWLRVLVCCSLVVQRFLRASVFSLLLEGLFWRGLKWKKVNILRWLMRALFVLVLSLKFLISLFLFLRSLFVRVLRVWMGGLSFLVLSFFPCSLMYS